MEAIREAFQHAFLLLTTPENMSQVSEMRHILLRPTLLNRILSVETEVSIRKAAINEAYQVFLASNPTLGAEEPYDSEYDEADVGNGECPQAPPARKRRKLKARASNPATGAEEPYESEYDEADVGNGECPQAPPARKRRKLKAVPKALSVGHLLQQLQVGLPYPCGCSAGLSVLAKLFDAVAACSLATPHAAFSCCYGREYQNLQIRLYLQSAH